MINLPFFKVLKMDIPTHIKYWLLQQNLIPKRLVSLVNQIVPLTLQNTLRLKFKKFSLIGRTAQNGEPTPENPIDIENVEGNVDIKVCNKNIFDFLNALNTKKSSAGTSDETSNGITLTGKGSWGNYRLVYNNKKNKDYTISYKVLSSVATKCGVTIYGADNTNFENLDSIVSGVPDIEANTEISENIQFNSGSYDYIVFAFWRNGTSTVFDNIETTVFSEVQLEEGTSATPYEEHKEQTILFPVATNQKLMEGDYFADDGIHHVKGQILLDGTEESWRSDNNQTLFGVSLPNAKDNRSTSAIPYGYCNRAIIGTLNNARIHEYNFNIYGSYGSVMCWFNDRDLTLNEFKTWVSNHNLLVEYELNEETIEPYTEAQALSYNKIKNLHGYNNMTIIDIESSNLKPNVSVDYYEMG